MASIVSAGTTSSTALNMSADTSGVLQLASNNGSVGLTIDTGQRTTFPTTIGIGNATPSTSGAGISFPATQSASSDANTLDDYEEGTWTATLTGTTTAPNTPVTTTAKYTKIGNQVTLWARFSNKDTTGASGYMHVTGIPFLGSGEGQVGSAWLYNLPIPQLYTVSFLSDATAYVSFWCMANNTSAVESNISAGTTKYLSFTITYFV